MPVSTRFFPTLFPAILLVINWDWSRSVHRPNTSSVAHIDGASFGILFCIIALPILSIRLVRLIRTLLDEQIRVPRNTQLFSWHLCLPLLFLLFQFSYTSSAVEGDTVTTITRGYGSDASLLLLVLASLLIILFQIYDSLKTYHQHPDLRPPLYHGLHAPI